MGFKTTSTKPALRGQSGATLVEFLIGLVISGLVLAQVSRTFVAQMNYVDMDQTSQRALDTLSREIRNTKALTSFATNQLVFTDYDDLPLTYSFSEKQLVRVKSGVKKVLLKDCDTASFAIYQRNPIEGAYDQYKAASAATCKLVEVKWKCSRKLFPSAPATQESMQSAKIVIRSNP